MKKLITPAFVALMAFSMFSCKKESSNKVAPEKVATVDSSKNSKGTTGISCAGVSRAEAMYPASSDPNQPFANGIVIARFPTSTNQMHVVLPKSSWTTSNQLGPIASYRLVNQNDGNLVLYKGAGGTFNTPIWSSNTQWQGGNTQFYLQNDWNMVGYTGYPNGAVWDTGTYQFKCGGPDLPQIYLFLRNDGDLQIIGRIGNFVSAAMGILSSTNTAGGVVNSNHTMTRYVGPQDGWNIY